MDPDGRAASATRPSFDLVLRLRFGNRLPLHVRRIVRPAARQRDDVVDDVAGPPVRKPRLPHEPTLGCLASLEVLARLPVRRGGVVAERWQANGGVSNRVRRGPPGEVGTGVEVNGSPRLSGRGLASRASGSRRVPGVRRHVGSILARVAVDVDLPAPGGRRREVKRPRCCRRGRSVE